MGWGTGVSVAVGGGVEVGEQAFRRNTMNTGNQIFFIESLQNKVSFMFNIFILSSHPSGVGLMLVLSLWDSSGIIAPIMKPIFNPSAAAQATAAATCDTCEPATA